VSENSTLRLLLLSELNKTLALEAVLTASGALVREHQAVLEEEREVRNS
jgi:hypothetical protein